MLVRFFIYICLTLFSNAQERRTSERCTRATNQDVLSGCWNSGWRSISGYDVSSSILATRVTFTEVTSLGQCAIECTTNVDCIACAVQDDHVYMLDNIVLDSGPSENKNSLFIKEEECAGRNVWSVKEFKSLRADCVVLLRSRGASITDCQQLTNDDNRCHRNLMFISNGSRCQCKAVTCSNTEEIASGYYSIHYKENFCDKYASNPDECTEEVQATYAYNEDNCQVFTNICKALANGYLVNELSDGCTENDNRAICDFEMYHINCNIPEQNFIACAVAQTSARVNKRCSDTNDRVTCKQWTQGMTLDGCRGLCAERVAGNERCEIFSWKENKNCRLTTFADEQAGGHNNGFPRNFDSSDSFYYPFDTDFVMNNFVPNGDDWLYCKWCSPNDSDLFCLMALVDRCKANVYYSRCQEICDEEELDLIDLWSNSFREAGEINDGRILGEWMGPFDSYGGFCFRRTDNPGCTCDNSEDVPTYYVEKIRESGNTCIQYRSRCDAMCEDDGGSGEYGRCPDVNDRRLLGAETICGSVVNFEHIRCPDVPDDIRALAQSVVKLGGCTAFKISSGKTTDLWLTNAHCSTNEREDVWFGNEARDRTCEDDPLTATHIMFENICDGDNGARLLTRTGSGASQNRHWNLYDDWAIYETDHANCPYGRELPPLELALQDAEVNDEIFVIGHPQDTGSSKILSRVEDGEPCRVVRAGMFLGYRCDTNVGMSGSPVFKQIDDTYKVVALHNFGGCDETADTGVNAMDFNKGINASQLRKMIPGISGAVANTVDQIPSAPSTSCICTEPQTKYIDATSFRTCGGYSPCFNDDLTDTFQENGVKKYHEASVCFVVDTSGSMGGEMSAVRNAINEVLDWLETSEYAKRERGGELLRCYEDYVLCTVNNRFFVDPTATSSFTDNGITKVQCASTRDRNKFRDVQEKMLSIASGGYEDVYQGIMAAMTNAMPTSECFVFTDESGNNNNEWKSAVEQKAKDKEIKVTVFTSGREFAHFRRLAELTGGDYKVTARRGDFSEELSNVIKGRLRTKCRAPDFVKECQQIDASTMGCGEMSTKESCPECDEFIITDASLRALYPRREQTGVLPSFGCSEGCTWVVKQEGRYFRSTRHYLGRLSNERSCKNAAISDNRCGGLIFTDGSICYCLDVNANVENTLNRLSSRRGAAFTVYQYECNRNDGCSEASCRLLAERLGVGEYRWDAARHQCSQINPSGRRRLEGSAIAGGTPAECNPNPINPPTVTPCKDLNQSTDISYIDECIARWTDVISDCSLDFHADTHSNLWSKCKQEDAFDDICFNHGCFYDDDVKSRVRGGDYIPFYADGDCPTNAIVGARTSPQDVINCCEFDQSCWIS